MDIEVPVFGKSEKEVKGEEGIEENGGERKNSSANKGNVKWGS